ncbi:lipopolysaccharide assembly protein LapB [Cypionkella sp.]|jgi:Flp pilus assembly protein TadD|uniref:tetratricopeptide repeat protein n=1 Tax=Cypionkella sp. TaxID=2811411 RepID=UPI0027249DE7|nr:tetratricopeptide repeat protein [Cypionkella sp.]MDO8985763.1 tetratricopeptide repeat protein [Cypionkella sp.]MDP1575785.1 tetratricopeptide repeat protein [Cypionkella sp.]MDP2051343.1 tetratricopeptide repeat protein [Cypionkella sp.]
MRQPVLLTLCLIGATALAGCQGTRDAASKRALKSVNVVDESNLSDIMLTVGDPNEAVAYFQKSSAENPDRIDLKRGLAKSLIRANKPSEAIGVYTAIIASSEATNDDRVGLADAQMRTSDWAATAATLNTIPPTFETFDRYRLEAMVADSQKNWKKADSFYDIAAGLTNKPSGVYNNWGFSKLTRGDNAGAEKLFLEALTYDSKLFTAKNNLILARAGQRKYDMPVIEMTQTERAQLYYTLGLAAVKQGDTSVGRELLQQAVDTSPTYFEAAERSLKALST